MREVLASCGDVRYDVPVCVSCNNPEKVLGRCSDEVWCGEV